jgi:alkylhydroperoxidase family enzyme
VTEQLERLMGTPEREPLRLFRTLVKNPGLARGFEALGSHNLSRGTLPVRDRELMILRTTALCQCAYEWGVHARVYAKAAMLTPDDVRNTAAGSAEMFSGTDRLVIRLADELHDRARVSPELMGLLRAAWNEAQLLELFEVAGFYHLVSFVANGAGVELEPWAVPMPAAWTPASPLASQPVDSGHGH